jgi:BirA family biotin operon repressor/biotin-[acetyl-CoA-carboxylase] ligase
MSAIEVNAVDPKVHILTVLRDADQPVSGERLRHSLGCSRVAVWKHVNGLKDQGYPITAGARGYRLEGGADILLAADFPGREDRIHHFAELDSTMTEARELARRDCPAFTVVVADRQRRGRGRLQRTWHSEAGGLYFTVVVRPELPVQQATWPVFAASLELARLLRERWGVEAGVKWPNDILAGGRKLAGMLSEMEAAGEMLTYVNIGIGLNVNNDPRDSEAGAVSLRELTGAPVSRRELLAAFLDRFEARLRSADLAGVIAAWKRWTVTLQREVRIVTTRETLTGYALDVDADGALLLRTADGQVRRVTHGDCFHQPGGNG